MSKSRTEKSVYMMGTGVLQQIITLVFGFVSRTVFIRVLGMTYLGINSLFTNVLSMLSLAELGIGTAITFLLYKPLAEDDTEKLQEIMKFYKIAYRIIGVAILIIGLCLIPFLKYLVKVDTPLDINLNLVYILFLLNTVISYLFFAYRSNIILADQKGYILNNINIVFIIIQNIVDILIIIITKNFILSLIVRIIIGIIKNLAIYIKSSKIFPFLNDKNGKKVSKSLVKEVMTKVYSIFVFQISSQLFYSTDNMIISAIVGTVYVGINANYILITSAVNRALTLLKSSFVAAVGNINAVESIETKYTMFKRLDFLNFWVTSFCAVCFYQLLNPFITLWTGKDYLFSQWTVNIMVANFFIAAALNIIFMYRETMGLFEYGKYRQLAAGIINIILSIILAKYWGVFGVFLATLISSLLVGVFPYPKIIYKYGFNKSPKEYYFKYIEYCILTIISCLLVRIASMIFSEVTYFTFIMQAILCIMIPNMFYYILFRKTDEFKYMKEKAYSILRKFKKKQQVLN